MFLLVCNNESTSLASISCFYETLREAKREMDHQLSLGEYDQVYLCVVLDVVRPRAVNGPADVPIAEL